MICLAWWELIISLLVGETIWRIGKALITGHPERRP